MTTTTVTSQRYQLVPSTLGMFVYDPVSQQLVDEDPMDLDEAVALVAELTAEDDEARREEQAAEAAMYQQMAELEHEWGELPDDMEWDDHGEYDA